MTTTAERTRLSWDRAAARPDHDLATASWLEMTPPLAKLSIRELISLLARTEDEIHRLRDGGADAGGRPGPLRRLLREQSQIIGELRRRRATAASQGGPG